VNRGPLAYFEKVRAISNLAKYTPTVLAMHFFSEQEKSNGAY
jgi:hypothetical protein